MAFRWRAHDGQTLNVGLVALWFFRGSGPVLQRKHVFLWGVFSGGGGRVGPLPHSLSGSVQGDNENYLYFSYPLQKLQEKARLICFYSCQSCTIVDAKGSS